MIVINKKRIQMIVSCVLIAMFAFSLQIANKNKKEAIKDSNIEKQQSNTITTTATPVSGKTIVIDAGHGVPDERGTKQYRNNRSGN